MNLTLDIIGKYVRVWLDHTRVSDPPFAEGKVIGYYDHPAFIIEGADGKQSTHSSRLRVEVVDPVPDAAMLRLRAEITRLHSALETATRGTERPATPIALLNQIGGLMDLLNAARERAADLWAAS